MSYEYHVFSAHRNLDALLAFLAENEAFVRLSSWEALNGGRFSVKVPPAVSPAAARSNYY